jgi:hypothetical protein
MDDYKILGFNVLTISAMGFLVWYFYNDIKKNSINQKRVSTSFGVRG